MARQAYGCDEYRQMTRRHCLGALAGFGAGSFLGLLDPRMLFAAAGSHATADSVILLWMGGGQSHIDTFDPKPGQATGGPFSTVDTAVKGVRLCEHLPMLAREFGDLALIRSMSGREGSHERATYQMHTGYLPLGSFQHSTLGSVAAKMTERLNDELPPYVSIGGGNRKAGFLGARFAPFHVAVPTDPTQNVTYHKSVNGPRFQNRMRLLSEFDEEFAEAHGGSEAIDAYAAQYNAALKMMHGRSVSAFNLELESPQVRERYGRHTFGQGCLLARRLVQSKVRFIEVTLGGWDTHQDNFAKVAEKCGVLDQAVSALIADLRERERLDRTLIVLTGEFGRTPKINGNNGRDHWPRVWSCLLAGGGVKGGRVIGRSTEGGHEVAERPVTVGALHASIVQALGIDPGAVNYSPDGRPIRVVQDKEAEPVRELFA